LEVADIPEMLDLREIQGIVVIEVALPMRFTCLSTEFVRGYRMNRPAIHVNIVDLVKHNRNAECCDCGQEAAEAAENNDEQIWTIWHNIHIYCPACAANEGIGIED
jgi:hypothetical protein